MQNRPHGCACIFYSNTSLGKKKTKLYDDLRDIDVVLATYQTAVATEQDRVALKKLAIGYAIFDEGHMLKNMNTGRYIKSLLEAHKEKS